jgi:hypothetical protein
MSKRLISLTLFVIVAASPAGTAQARQGSPAWRVQFTSGGSIDVSSYTVDEGRLVMFLEDGGTFTVSATQVRRVERVEIPLEDVPATVSPLPGAAPAAEPPGAVPSAPPARMPAPPAAAPDIDTLVNEAAARYGLEADLLAAVIAVESGYRPQAISPKGAQGLMQLMPGTARELAVSDAFDPAQNIDAGARHLKRLIDQNGGTYWRALAAYNAGEGNVARYKGLPPFRETMSYVRKVLDKYGKPRASTGALRPR